MCFRGPRAVTWRALPLSIDSRDGFVGQGLQQWIGHHLQPPDARGRRQRWLPLRTRAFGDRREVRQQRRDQRASSPHARTPQAVQVTCESDALAMELVAAGALVVFDDSTTVSGCRQLPAQTTASTRCGTPARAGTCSAGPTVCRKLFTSAQACLPMHLNGCPAYRCTVADPSITNGNRVSWRLIPAILGARKLSYAGGSGGGADATAEFSEDWEAQSASRDVVFPGWPDGTHRRRSRRGLASMTTASAPIRQP